MRVQGKHIKLFDTNTQPGGDGEESHIGTAFRSRKGRWHFNPAPDWCLCADQMQRISKLLEALEECDRGA